MNSISEPKVMLFFSVFNNLKDTQARSKTDWPGLKALIERSPSNVAKTEALCVAAHDCKIKTKAAVLDHDSMTLLWVDLDKGNKPLIDIEATLAGLSIESALIYETFSSLPQNKKWRVLIELGAPMTCENWIAAQTVLAEKFDGDRCAIRPQQVFFAPNMPQRG